MVAINTQSSLSSESTQPAVASTKVSETSRQEALYDATLVRRFNSGDETAFDEIVARYRSKMFSIALSHLRNHSDAEEIAQDTLVRAHRGLSRFRGDSSLATWLYRIAFNLSRNRYKYHFCRSRHAEVSLDGACSDDSDATLSDMIACNAPNPSREATSSEFTELVGKCMEKLGARQRQILALRNGQDQSYGEIARGLGISTGTVKSRIGRARKRLRELVSLSYPEMQPEGSTFDWFETTRFSGRVGVLTS